MVIEVIDHKERIMITIKEKKKCCGCTACATICPHHALTMKADKSGFLYPIVDKNKCINCGLCEKVCPILHENEERIPTYSFAIKNNDEEVRLKSSSGGLFPIIAGKTIEAGGIVYGATFDKQWNVKHIGITKMEDLHLLQGSKYVQSNTIGIYKNIKQKLLEGINVLFTGTPCQVAGLNHYLQKRYKNLITIDFICHGVPSPKIWKDYLSELKDLHNHPITNIEFRNKATGWKDYQFIITFADSVKDGEKTQKYICHHTDNLYMRLFLDNYILRPSCHSCIFRKGKGGSSYTLGDYWGIQNFNAEFDDNRGTSLFLGYDDPSIIPQCISQHCTVIKTPVELALTSNPSYTRDWPQSRYSHVFFFLHNYFPLKLISCFSICLKINKIATKLKCISALKSIQKGT